MNKTMLIAEIVSRFENHPIIFTTGYASRIAFGLRPSSPNHFYMLGSMGMASAVGRGVASRLGTSARYPVIVDGDGAVLMGLHCLLLEREAPSAILHIVANDSTYASTGGQQVPASIDAICDLARAAGYGFVKELHMASSTFAESLPAAVSAVLGGNSALLNCHVDPGPSPLVRVDLPLPDIAMQFKAFVDDQSGRNTSGTKSLRAG
ncbi:thiamine pyrophosphate-dependent enzyme [Paucibacter sp. B2R-40]|uniref:thiamine pyrophosphate-dependent enzyme n=1 Tax=Paucibacter sp. B2R-40 TaxID=2893554 RepID=UPI00398CEE45